MICECGIPVYGKFPYFCPCGLRHDENGTSPAVLGPMPTVQPKKEPQPVPEPGWPAWAKLLAGRKTETDKGVGDTFQRLAASMGGEIFKKLTKSMGLPCGCDARQADWNRLYPYI